MKKKYWLRGGIVGAGFYAFCIFIMYALEAQNQYQPNPASGIGVAVVVMLFWPSIPLGLILGWLYGKTKNKVK